MFMTFRLSPRNARLAAVAAAVGLLITMAPPAWAHGVGVTTNGASNITGDATPDPEDPLCLPADDTSIKLWNVGGFNNNPGLFDTVATFTSAQTYYFGPGGTYSDDQCEDLTEVLGTLSVSGDVICDSVAATYQRVTSAYVIQTTQSTTCAIKGTGNSHAEEHLKFTGVQQACGGPMVDPCDPNGTRSDDSDNVEFTGDHEQGI